MAAKKGNSLLETRRRNRVLIKNMIFRMENATRTGIAEALELTLPTITTSINEMLSEGIIEEVPLSEELLANVIGRKPTAIAFCANAACTIGVELGPYATRAVVLNMKGEILASADEETIEEDYEGMLHKVAELVKKILPVTDEKNLLGIGIGLPGFIECEKGMIRSNPKRDLKKEDWVGKHFAQDMSELLGCPVIIDNNVRLRAIGYEMGYSGTKPDTFAYFYISRGLACPLMVKDDIVSGNNAGAGEIGHTVIEVVEQGEKKQEILDNLGAEKAIFEKCQKKMLSGGAKTLKKLLEEEGHLTMKMILQAQETDADVKAVVEEAIEYLGIGLANVVNFINPGLVVVDGYLMTTKENQQCLLQSAKQKFFGLNEEEVQVRFLEFDHYCGAKGAAYFAIHKLFLEK